MKAILFLSVLFCHNLFGQNSESLLIHLSFNGDKVDRGILALPVEPYMAEHTTDRYNRSKSALLWNGKNSFVSIADTSAFRPQNFSFTTWFKFDSIPTSQSTIVDKSIGTSTINSFHVGFESNKIYASVGDQVENGVVSEVPVMIDKDLWMHLAFVFSDEHNYQKLYLNGILLDSTTNSKSVYWDTNAIVLGADMNNTVKTAFFPGKIDDVKFYSKVLTEDELQNDRKKEDTLKISYKGDHLYVVVGALLESQIKFHVYPSLINHAVCNSFINIDFESLDQVKGAYIRIVDNRGRVVHIEPVNDIKMQIDAALLRGINYLQLVDINNNPLSTVVKIWVVE